MPSDYGGTITALNGLLPSFVHISSSTNTSPISVTTTAPHGAETGDTVVIDGHLSNLTANGSWEVVVTSVTTLLLVDSTGIAVGGADGTLRCAAFGSLFQIPSGTDVLSAASVNVALEALGDRTALLLYLLNFKQQVYAGGHTTYHEDSILELGSGSVLQGDGGSALLGTFTLGDGAGGSLFQVAAHSAISLEASGAFTTAAGSIVSILGDLEISGAATFELGVKMEVQGTGSIVLDTNAHLDVHSNAAINLSGGSSVTGTTKFDGVVMSAGSAITMAAGGASNTLALNNTSFQLNSTCVVADASSSTRTGPTVRSGVDAYVGGRSRYLSSHSTGTENIATEQQEYIVSATTQSANVTWKLGDPPNGERIDVTLNVFATRLNGNTLTVQDSGGVTIITFPVGFAANSWCDLRWDVGASTYVIVRQGALP